MLNPKYMFINTYWALQKVYPQASVRDRLEKNEIEKISEAWGMKRIAVA